MSKLAVGHVCPCYLPLSETFIYNYLRSFQAVAPVVLAGRIENAALFPLGHRVLDCSHRRFTGRWLINAVGRRLLGTDDLYRKTVLRRHGARLLHAHFGPTGYGLLPLKRALGIPLVTNFYGYDMSSLARDPAWRRNYAALFTEGDLFLVEGSHMKKDLVGLGCPEQKVRIQHIAIDTSQFAFRPRLPRGDGPVRMFFCGRFTEKKGLIYALRALNVVRSDHPNIHLTVIGDGKLRPEIERFVEEHELGPAVDLLGYQPHDVVAREMARADIFLQPSVTAANGDTEGGAPTIILEAQAAGVPVLATSHADIPEVVRPGESALLVAERDWEALAAAMRQMMADQQSWQDMGRAGREHVEQHYDIKREVLHLERIYRELAGDAA